MENGLFILILVGAVVVGTLVGLVLRKVLGVSPWRQQLEQQRQLLRRVFSGASSFGRQFEQQLKSLEAFHQQWDTMSVQEQASRKAQLVQALQQLSQLSARVDNVTRQRHEIRVGRLMGLAGRAGINWHP